MQCHDLCPSQRELLGSEVVPHSSSLYPPPGLLLSPTSFSSSPWLLNTRAHPTLQHPCQGAQATENWPYQEREREERDQHFPLNKGHGRRTVQWWSQEETASLAIRWRYLHHKPAPLFFHWRHSPLTVQPHCQCQGWERSRNIILLPARGFGFISCTNKCWNQAREWKISWPSSTASSVRSWTCFCSSELTALHTHTPCHQEGDKAQPHHFPWSSHLLFPSHSSCPSTPSPVLWQSCRDFSRAAGTTKAVLAGRPTIPRERHSAPALPRFCFTERYKLCCLSRTCVRACLHS